MKKILALLVLLMPIMAYAQCYFQFDASKMSVEHLSDNQWDPVYYTDSCKVNLIADAVNVTITDFQTKSVYNIIYAYETVQKENDLTVTILNCRTIGHEKCAIVYYKYKSGYQEVHIDFANRRLRYWMY